MRKITIYHIYILEKPSKVSYNRYTSKEHILGGTSQNRITSQQSHSVTHRPHFRDQRQKEMYLYLNGSKELLTERVKDGATLFQLELFGILTEIFSHCLSLRVKVVEGGLCFSQTRLRIL